MMHVCARIYADGIGFEGFRMLSDSLIKTAAGPDTGAYHCEWA
jgi:hypothetical protein